MASEVYDETSTYSCDKTFDETLEKPSMFWGAIHILHRILVIFIRIVAVLFFGGHGDAMPDICDPILLESAVSIAEKIRTEQITATQVMKIFIRRIRRINPLLNCVVDERFKDALQEAAEVDALIASKKYTVDELEEMKPFLGVPFSAKDSIGVKGMLQTCGLWFRRDIRSERDADTIQLMRNAGAIPFVLTNIPELCMWWESVNTIYGGTSNPYDTNRIVGGSSGGEACLLAAAGSPFGLGTEMSGSIRLPAFFNGIFGHKPSPKIISNDGIWPKPIGEGECYATSVGPMCRFACDLKAMLKVIAGDRAKELDLDKPVDLKQLKYYYQLSDGGGFLVSSVENCIRAGIDKTLKHLFAELNVHPEMVKFPKLLDSLSIWYATLKYAGPGTLERYLAELKENMNPFMEMLKWFVGMSDYTYVAITFTFQEKLGDLQFGSPEYLKKIDECHCLRRQFEELLGDDGVFIYPTHPTVAPYNIETVARTKDCGYTCIFNALGFPSTTIPLGIGPNERLPVGLQVVANHNQDRLCFAVASELERAFGGWVPPKFSKTV